MMKICITCGMPMKDPSDFPLGEQSKDYSVRYAHPDGTMQIYEENLKSLSDFIV